MKNCIFLLIFSFFSLSSSAEEQAKLVRSRTVLQLAIFDYVKSRENTVSKVFDNCDILSNSDYATQEQMIALYECLIKMEKAGRP